MPRRVSMPTADDLFRPTADPDAVPRTSSARANAARAVEPAAPRKRAAAARKPSGRVKHDEKMTVYVTSDELIDLEHARLTLRRDLGMAVDRGRIVRQAVALALEDLEANGEDSALVRRLLGE